MMTWARAQSRREPAGMGLTRFKDSFAPRHQPLYMAAPGRGALALAAADLALPCDVLPEPGHSPFPRRARLRMRDPEQARPPARPGALPGEPDDRCPVPTAANPRLADGRWRHRHQPLQHGADRGDAPEMWNIDHPDRIRTLLPLGVEAGSDIFLTNTFGGNASR